jgi:hypothetical protein
MILALLLFAVCTPLPTCSATITTNCATPTPVLSWDRTPDDLTTTPPSIIAGYKLYACFPGGTPQLVRDYPYWLEDDGVTKRFYGVDIPVPIQRVTSTEFQDVEYRVKAYDTAGRVSQNYSNVITLCPSHVWVKPEPYN